MLLKQEPKNAKEAIFAVLLESHPKKAADIRREIERFGVNITIQGVVKSLKLMERNGIISKNDAGFSISPKYLQQLQQTAEKAAKSYEQPAMKIKKIATSVEIYTVNNMLEQDSLWAKVSMEWIKRNPKDKKKAWIGRHCWWLLARLEHEDTFHDFMISHGAKSHNLVTGNNPLDKAAVEYYKKKKIPIRIDKKADIGNVYIESFGDFYMRCEIPKEISQELEKLYRIAKRIEDVNMKEVIDLLKRKIPITVAVIRDSAAAKKIRQDILSKF